MSFLLEQFEVESTSKAGKKYTVSKYTDHYACSCIGWTRHVPRKDCRHIEWVREFGPRPIDSLLQSIRKANRKQLLCEMRAEARAFSMSPCVTGRTLRKAIGEAVIATAIEKGGQ